MFFGTVDENGYLEFINAGHPSPFLLRRGEAEEAFTEGSCPLGLIPSAQYTVVRAQLEQGDTLILFSDGVTEAMDPEEGFYGMSRLKECLTGHTADDSLEQLQQCVLDSVEDFTRGASQADDLTLLVVRYRGIVGH